MCSQPRGKMGILVQRRESNGSKGVAHAKPSSVEADRIPLDSADSCLCCVSNPLLLAAHRLRQ